MRISLSWLKQYIELREAPDEIAKLLTNCGLEVGQIRSTIPNKNFCKDLVVGQVKSCTNHPNADRLKLLKVDIGLDSDLDIVCGAPNVAHGQRVIVAPVGSTIMNCVGETLEIKKAKIRGATSEGMVCSEYEIGLGEEYDRIFTYPDASAPLVGSKVLDLLSLTEEVVFDVELTPNRGDAASHLGVARDLSAKLDRDLFYPKLSGAFRFNINTNSPCPISIEIPAGIGCNRYSGVVIENVRLKESPAWLKQRLSAIGVDSKNNVVDITNYVMYESGHPLHAYDYDLLVGKKIFLQKAHLNTKMRTLDGVERTFDNAELLIYDAEGPICIAGVMGGERTAISSSTKNIFLELACFSPKAVRNSTKSQGLHTEASFRFERGGPFDPEYFIRRAVDLVLNETGGEVDYNAVDLVVEEIPPLCEVLFRFKTLERISGIRIPTPEIKKIFAGLEIFIRKEQDDELLLDVPTFKTDVLREIDVVEEVLRIYGYDRIPIDKRISFPTFFDASMSSTFSTNDAKKDISSILVSRGFYEIRTNPITNSKYCDVCVGEEANGHIPLLNPNSSVLDSMRCTLMFSGLEVIAHNRNRHKDQYCKFFEFGRVYSHKDDVVSEHNRLAIWLSGVVADKNWYETKEKPSFYHISSHVYDILWKILGVKDFFIEKIKSRFFSEVIELRYKGLEVAKLGTLHSVVSRSFGLHSPTFFADLNWDLLLQKALHKIAYKPLSKYPAVQRDISILISKPICFNDIKQVVASSIHKELIDSIELIDVYTGDDLPDGKISYSLRIIMQPYERTLHSEEIDREIQSIENNLKTRLHAQIR